MTHKEQPNATQLAMNEAITPDMQKGLELAAYICRMYGDGEIWAETILRKGEQNRALFHMRLNP